MDATLEKHNIRSKKSMLTLKQKLFWFKSRLLHNRKPMAEVYKVITEEGTPMKLLQLTKDGIKYGYQNRLKRFQDALHYYDEFSGVPQLHFAGPDYLAVQWLEGRPLEEKVMQDADYHQLGEFLAEGFKDAREISPDQDAAVCKEKCRFLAVHQVIGDQAVAGINAFLEGAGNIPHPIAEAMGFADTVDKNFIKRPDGSLGYIDIFGVKRLPVGSVFAKRVAITPVDGRSVFAESFRDKFESINSSLSYDLIGSLPFYYLRFILSRLGTSVERDMKARSAQGLNLLNAWLERSGKKEDVNAWILREAEVMV